MFEITFIGNVWSVSYDLCVFFSNFYVYSINLPKTSTVINGLRSSFVRLIKNVCSTNDQSLSETKEFLSF